MSGAVLTPSLVRLSGTATDQASAIDEVGAMLVASGAVDPAYVGFMHEREKSVSTYMGSLLAIPHGTNAARALIRRTAIAFIRYPEPISWNGNPVRFVVGIAGGDDAHMEVLAGIAMLFMDAEGVAALERATTAEEVIALFG